MKDGYRTLGWQWGCQETEPHDDPDYRFEDAWQNPDQGASMARAAQAHADRTGHQTFIEKHVRRDIQPRSHAA